METLRQSSELISVHGSTMMAAAEARVCSPHFIAEAGRSLGGSEVRIGSLTAGEDLVPISRWIKEINRLPPGDAMPGRSDIERDVVAGDHIGGMTDVTP
jgi:hypothetical protein